MEKRFKILRLIGTIWKIIAWITLILGFISSLGVLIGSIAGGGLFSQLGEQYGINLAFGIVGGLVAFALSMVFTVIYFLSLYAVGELIYLLIAIEENTRLTAQWVAHNGGM